MPKTIGIITSPTGAAIRDIMSVLKRRYPAGNIIVYPAAVQGDGAAEQITTMLKTAEQRNECDVIILSRGGGSIEDLWAFNNEILARAIFDCSLPVVSGIGHEIDFTIADFVADQRAATPSAAAELVSPDQMHIRQNVSLQQNRLIQILQASLSTLRQNITHLEKRLPHPATQLQNNAQRLDALYTRMDHSIKSIVTLQNHRLHEQLSTLNKHSPLQKLQFYIERSGQLHQRLHQAANNLWRNLDSQIQTVARALNTVSPLATLNRAGILDDFTLDNNNEDKPIMLNQPAAPEGGVLPNIEFVRVEYDIEKAVAKVKAVPELDDFLGERLYEGR